MTPYPLYYTPDGVAKPDCCPHVAPLACLPGKGPDAYAGADGSIQAGSGLCWGGALPLRGSVLWSRARPGWYVALEGITPQALRRVSVHPRILRWVTIPGVSIHHRWRVPVLITRDENGDAVLAVDRILTPTGWRESDDLAPIVERLLAVHAGKPLHEDPEERNAAVTALALEILALGQWVSRDLLEITGWIGESMLVDTLRAAMNRAPDEMEDPR